MVLNRQLQVSTGTAGKWAPVHTGFVIIEKINNTDKTAIFMKSERAKTVWVNTEGCVQKLLSKYCFYLNLSLPMKISDATVKEISLVARI